LLFFQPPDSILPWTQWSYFFRLLCPTWIYSTLLPYTNLFQLFWACSDCTSYKMDGRCPEIMKAHVLGGWKKWVFKKNRNLFSREQEGNLNGFFFLKTLGRTQWRFKVGSFLKILGWTQRIFKNGFFPKIIVKNTKEILNGFFHKKLRKITKEICKWVFP